MKQTLSAMAALMVATAASAAVTASIDGGTSYIHLGKLHARECAAFVGSPASAGLLLAFDGHILAKGENACHEGVRLDIVTRNPVVSTSDGAITTWPLSKDDCREAVAKLMKAPALIAVNGHPVANTPDGQAACSRASNSISVPR